MSLYDIAKGMGVTLGQLFKRPVTVRYPEQPVALEPRFRGPPSPAAPSRHRTGEVHRLQPLRRRLPGLRHLCGGG